MRQGVLGQVVDGVDVCVEGAFPLVPDEKKYNQMTAHLSFRKGFNSLCEVLDIRDHILRPRIVH